MTRAVAPVRDRAAAPARIALRGLPRYDVDAICLPLHAFAPTRRGDFDGSYHACYNGRSVAARGAGREGGSVRTYMIRRLLLMIPTVFVVTFIVFVLMRLVPGDVVDIMVSQFAIELSLIHI